MQLMLLKHLNNVAIGQFLCAEDYLNSTVLFKIRIVTSDLYPTNLLFIWPDAPVHKPTLKNDQKYKLFLTVLNTNQVFWMICILIKCSASLFNHTVKYASAPVALEIHSSCCYNTFLGVSADHIITFLLFISITYSPTHSDERFYLC